MFDAPEAQQYLIEAGIATEEEIALVTSINGWTLDSLQDILYVRTGYRTFAQYHGIDDEDEDNE